MSRPRRARAFFVAFTLLVVAGCQDYNFNPVGHCVLQPGSEKFTLSNLSSADVLFVVDDSGSMGGEQARLAVAFDEFVQNLTSANVARAQALLEPIDYHIAVTTSAVYWNPIQSGQTCQSNCADAPGQLVCCNGSTTAARQPRKCVSDAQCSPLGAGIGCRTTCNGLKGEGYCCAADNTFPGAAATADLVFCATAGIPCGRLETHYAYAGQCASGIGIGNAPPENGWPYPRGDFVSFVTTTATPTANPRVLHFDKRLARQGVNSQGFTQQELISFFKQNALVGICGSGQEQGLQAARLAIQKTIGGLQKDTYPYDPAYDPSVSGRVTQSWDPATRTAGHAAVWGQNPNAKLVLVVIGDEDDCAGPEDPSGGVVMLSEGPGQDACTRDAITDPPLGRKEFPVSSFVDYYTSIGRPLGAAVIASARSSGSDNSCSGATCNAAVCCDTGCTGSPLQCTSTTCGGQASGTRLVEAARQLQARGVDTVIGSICDPDFGTLLNQVAEIVKPPQTLSLPSEPAESDITLLRIIQPNGDTKKLCGRPLAPRQPTNYTLQEAQATGADWWFTATADPGPPYDPTGVATTAIPSRFVYINSQFGSCRGDLGDTYSADYLGVIPEGGCLTNDECTQKLGGAAGTLECFTPPGLSRGTCTCAGTAP